MQDARDGPLEDLHSQFHQLADVFKLYGVQVGVRPKRGCGPRLLRLGAALTLLRRRRCRCLPLRLLVDTVLVLAAYAESQLQAVPFAVSDGRADACASTGPSPPPLRERPRSGTETTHPASYSPSSAFNTVRTAVRPYPFSIGQFVGRFDLVKHSDTRRIERGPGKLLGHATVAGILVSRSYGLALVKHGVRELGLRLR